MEFLVSNIVPPYVLWLIDQQGGVKSIKSSEETSHSLWHVELWTPPQLSEVQVENKKRTWNESFNQRLGKFSYTVIPTSDCFLFHVGKNCLTKSPPDRNSQPAHYHLPRCSLTSKKNLQSHPAGPPRRTYMGLVMPVCIPLPTAFSF